MDWIFTFWRLNGDLKNYGHLLSLEPIEIREGLFDRELK